jgi:cytochrome c-type biogenesis protein
LIGIIVSTIGFGITKFLPWIAVVSGIIVIAIGAAKLFEKTIFYVNIPSPSILVNIGNNNNNESRGKYAKFLLFGIGYAVASLSCTIPIFLLVVVQGLSAGGITEGSVVFLSYALGMGSVMTAVSIAIGVSNQTFVKWLRKIIPKIYLITSMVLILAGSYLIYYNLSVGKLL